VKPDRLAGGLPTGGYGETEGVKLGETHDEKYWSDRLTARLAEEYDAGIGKCIHVDLPDGVRAQGLSVAYNAGVGALCGSQIVAKWNAGDILGGCLAIRGWRVGSHPVKGGPLVIQRGLVNRRNRESAACFAAAHEPVKSAPVVVAEAPKPAPVEVPKPHAVSVKPHAVKPVPKKPLLCWIFKC
jgi:GH24 family phage-related lysozyme (muramidase)